MIPGKNGTLPEMTPCSQVVWLRFLRPAWLALDLVFLAVFCVAGADPPEDAFVSARVVGLVTDSGGKAIAGAKVVINSTRGARIDGRLPTSLTDADGRYEATLRFAKGKTLTVRLIYAEAKGYVRSAADTEFPLNDGETRKLPFVLHQGEIFSGVVRVPLTDIDRLSGIKVETVQRIIEIAGPALDSLPLNARTHLTEPGGWFECWVPPGEYLVRLHGYGPNPVEWSGLKSGRSDLVLDLPPFEWSQTNVAKAFDQLWEQMDRRYSYFFLKRDVDWKASKEKYRPKAIQSKNAKDLTAALLDMLAPLRDLHVKIESPEGTIPTYRIPWTYNGNFDVTLTELEGRTECGKFAVVGQTKGDGFGCFLMNRQSEANSAEVQKAVEAIKKLNRASGFIVDLRRANGGSEPLATAIAKLFCAKDTVYAKSKYRSGPSHDDFGKENERVLPASPEPYTKPVICLIGPGAVSSGEGFVKMMKCLPNVTLVGLPTRGASGNPQPWPLSGTGVIVYFSRWVDLMPDGRTFEGVGIPPDVEVNEPSTAYAERDPTWEKGIELLRQRVAKSKAVNN
jgi:C-terminal processing protease CtpA/Prc